MNNKTTQSNEDVVAELLKGETLKLQVLEPGAQPPAGKITDYFTDGHQSLTGKADEQMNPLLEQEWVSQNGQSIKIKDMTESHAKNALAFVLDKISKRHPVWTNRTTGQFKYDPTKVLKKPVEMSDVKLILNLIQEINNLN